MNYNNSKPNIGVSIICNAYNHEKYIRDALDGFVMQKTDFAFEVLIHDDASTDKTADIIREYEAKYPDLIKPIYQTENQYSKGGVSRFQYPRVKGKYIAFCEGDDYWTDPLKLQKQYDAMENHPEIDICAHEAVRVDADSKQTIGIIAPRKETCVICVEDVIYGEGGFVSTNSLFYRASLNKCIPQFRESYKLDYTLQIHGSLRGGMLYLADCMSAYRYMSVGSWTSSMQTNTKKQLVVFQKKQAMLSALNQETDYKFDGIIQKRMLKNQVGQLLQSKNYKELYKKEYRDVYREYPFALRAKIRLIYTFPFLMVAKSKMREMLKGKSNGK